MFSKIAESENAVVLDDAGKVRQVFARLGKDEATELEIARTARQMGVTLPRLKDHTELGQNGLLKVRE